MKYSYCKSNLYMSSGSSEGFNDFKLDDLLDEILLGL